MNYTGGERENLCAGTHIHTDRAHIHKKAPLQKRSTCFEKPPPFLIRLFSPCFVSLHPLRMRARHKLSKSKLTIKTILYTHFGRKTSLGNDDNPDGLVFEYRTLYGMTLTNPICIIYTIYYCCNPRTMLFVELTGEKTKKNKKKQTIRNKEPTSVIMDEHLFFLVLFYLF